jgi:multidrug efflux pump subunit AcrA (membrane-fusion protein)
LKSDLESMTVHAPFDGVVYYGQLSQGSWQNANPRSLRVGEKLSSAQVIMTLVQPGKHKLIVDVPEAKLSWIKPGAPARVVPVALPDAASDGKCAEAAPSGQPKDGGQAFQTSIELASVDARLAPGMKATARIDAGSATDVLVVPVSAVHKGRVKLYRDGKDEWHDVVVGRSDGELVEIRSGLSEGDHVLTKAEK